MSAASAAAEPEWRPRFNPWLIAVASMIATFMEVLDTSIANVALPHIAGSLSASNDQSTWVLTSYLISNAIILPATGWLSARFGRKRFLMACITIFTLSSVACGAAASLGLLLLARVIQGAGGGALQPISQAVLFESFPPAKRGIASAVFGIGVVVAPIIGPTLGGWITDNYSWRWIFYINLPIGLLALLMVKAVVEDPPYVRNAARTSIDYVGFGLMALWLATLQIVLDKGQEVDWFSAPWITWFSVVSGAALVAFVVWELRAAAPIVDLRVFTNRNFAVGTALIGVVGAVLYAMTALLPLFLQTLMGYPALNSGLAVSPRGVGAMLAMALVGRLVSVIDTRALLGFGFVLLGASAFMLGHINLDIGMLTIVWPNIVNGVALGFLFVPLTAAAVGTLKPPQMGNATGLFNLMRNLGGSVGISMATTLIARKAQVHQAMLVSHITPYDAPARQWMEAMRAALTPKVGAVAAAQQSMAALYATVVKQATLLAFVDTFRLLAALCLLAIPTVLLLKRTAVKGPIAAH